MRLADAEVPSLPIDETDGAKPFVKWAGRKTQLLVAFEALYPRPAEATRYLEPFLGSGAVFFQVLNLLRPKEVILTDTNAELINAFGTVKAQAEALVRALTRHKERHSEEYFYQVRAQDPALLADVARAARLIYLNKTCFNGLYRVNSKGIFNVPFGRYVNPAIVDGEKLRRASAALKDVELRVAHFRALLESARKGDFIYFDPPYHPVSATAYFTSYTDGNFGQADQEELADIYTKLDRRGCRLMLSNSDAPLINQLYKGFDVRKLQARRSINSRADRRGPVTEVVVLNYQPAAERTRRRTGE